MAEPPRVSEITWLEPYPDLLLEGIPDRQPVADRGRTAHHAAPPLRIPRPCRSNPGRGAGAHRPCRDDRTRGGRAMACRGQSPAAVADRAERSGRDGLFGEGTG